MAPASVDPVEATPDSTVSKMTATKSSTTRIPTMSLPLAANRLPVSRSILTSMAELLMLKAVPRKTLSMPDQPSNVPTSYPSTNIMVISTRAMMITLVPTQRIRCQPNSRPIPNKSSTSPRSANSRMVSTFCTGGSGRVNGPIMTPDRR